jgi:membrane protein DedA with SNARE-associated domain
MTETQNKRFQGLRSAIGFFRWYDIIWIIIWVLVLAFIGALAQGVYSENFLNAGNMLTGIFVAVLVIVPVVRAIPAIIRRQRRSAAMAEVKAGGN